jgi:RNA polymerase sigma-70 factor (ECF subfamily)
MDDILMDIFDSKTPDTDSTETAPAELSGAEFARSALVEYERPLTRYAAHLVGDRERAREVVQDTFLKLCTQKPSRIRNHLAQWLYTVCRNRALDVRKKESRMTPISDAQLSMQIDCRAEPSVLAEQEEQLNRALAVLSTLPANQQEVLRLKFQGDLSYGEISRITRLSVGNVGFLIHTGLSTIRERIYDRPSGKAMRRAK